MGPRSTDSPTYPSPCKGANEDRSGGDGNSVCENSCSAATPSSVHLIGSPLVRELSDLSGSYVNGSPLPPSGRGGIPRNIFGSPRDSPLTIRQPWRQAHSLSSPAPDVDGPRMPVLNSSGVDEMIVVEGNGGVEVMSPEITPEKAPLDVFESGAESHGERCPVVIILMNPGFKTYELMQLWLDTKTDTVRDVLQTLRQSLPNTWNQDYDGLAQFRREKLSQLINCLRIEQFAVVPHEIWVAKPWALAADKTARYAENLLEHLKMVGAVSSSAAADLPPRIGDAPATDGVLTLSAEAKRRIYSPDGVLTHHHAIQYLSFGPPFEKPFERPPIFPSSVAIANRRTLSPSPPARIHSPNNYVAPLPPPTSYKEIDIASGAPQSRSISPAISARSISPMEYSSASSAKTPDFSTDASTDESQDWDDGTIKMASNLGDHGSLRDSFQKIASQCELALNRRRSSASSPKRHKSLKHLRSCFSALNCGKRTKDEQAVARRQGSEEFTTQGSTFSLSFGHDENSLGHHLMTTLFEIDEEDERSMADMPLLGSRGYTDDEFLA